MALEYWCLGLLPLGLISDLGAVGTDSVVVILFLVRYTCMRDA